ncbi:MAG: acetoacetate decarboxylase family protein [Desulfosudaceae bacterium]
MNTVDNRRGYDDFRKDAFFDVPNIRTRTSVSDVELPMLFDRTRVRHLNYFISPARVDPLLKGTGLVPCRFFNGKCIVSLIFYNYREVTIGAYEEVTITILVRPEMLPDPRIYITNLLKKKGESWNGIGAYVLEMPVTIPRARAAGRELWGFPKFETRIPFSLSGHTFEFGVKDPEKDEWIVQVKGRHSVGIPLKGFDLVTLSNFRDKIWKTIVHTEVTYKTCRLKDIDVKTGGSSHGMAENIKALGLDRAKPFVVQVSDHFKSRLNPGRAIADWPTPPMPYPPPGGDGVAEGITV